MDHPELTVIIPTLNEEGLLERTLSSLADQEGVKMEVIVADGGSTDATQLIAMEAKGVILVSVTPAGKSRQMNCGASLARGEFLLFIHGDSRFLDTNALRIGIDRLRQAGRTHQVGGNFSLTFALEGGSDSPLYRFYQRKARLNRPGCNHGDQGFLLPAPLFREAGPFCEECDILAQTRFADGLRREGRWLRLEPRILTSARRFQAEGLLRRQLLNGIIMLCGAAGRDDLLARIPGLYRQQRDCGRLSLLPYLAILRSVVGALPGGEKDEFWKRCGSYLVGNAWQLALLMDVAGGMLRGKKGGDEPTPMLDIFDRHLYRCLDNGPSKKGAALLLRCLLGLIPLPAPERME